MSGSDVGALALGLGPATWLPLYHGIFTIRKVALTVKLIMTSGASTHRGYVVLWVRGTTHLSLSATTMVMGRSFEALGFNRVGAHRALLGILTRWDVEHPGGEVRESGAKICVLFGLDG